MKRIFIVALFAVCAVFWAGGAWGMVYYPSAEASNDTLDHDLWGAWINHDQEDSTWLNNYLPNLTWIYAATGVTEGLLHKSTGYNSGINLFEGDPWSGSSGVLPHVPYSLGLDSTFMISYVGRPWWAFEAIEGYDIDLEDTYDFPNDIGYYSIASFDTLDLNEDYEDNINTVLAALGRSPVAGIIVWCAAYTKQNGHDGWVGDVYRNPQSDYGFPYRSLIITGYNTGKKYWICRDPFAPGNGVVKIGFSEDGDEQPRLESIQCCVARVNRSCFPEDYPEQYLQCLDFQRFDPETGILSYYPSFAALMDSVTTNDSLFISTGITIAAGDTVNIPSGATVCIPQETWEYDPWLDDYVVTETTPINVYGTLNVGSGVTFTCLSDTAWTGLIIQSGGKMNATGPCAISNAQVGINTRNNTIPIDNDDPGKRITITDCGSGLSVSQGAEHLHYFTVDSCNFGIQLDSCSSSTELHNITITNCSLGFRASNCSSPYIHNSSISTTLGTGTGVSLSASGWPGIEETTISGFNYGMSVGWETDVQLIHCEISNCTKGISVGNSSSANMWKSKVTNCTYCLYGTGNGGLSTEYVDGGLYGGSIIIPRDTTIVGCSVTTGASGYASVGWDWWGGTPNASWFSGNVGYTPWQSAAPSDAGRTDPYNNKPVASGKEEQPEQETEVVENSISIAPNPANPMTTITYSLKNSGNAKLTIYAANGQKVATLVDGVVSAGVHSATFNGSKLASGVYFYRFESPGMKKTGKMLLLK